MSVPQETTQAVLFQLAQKHNEHPVVATLLSQLAQANGTAQAALLAVQARAQLIEASLERKARVPLDSSEFVQQSAIVASALARMNEIYATLAATLKMQGEDLLY